MYMINTTMKLIIFTINIFLLLTSLVVAKPIDELIIKGNERISSETIKVFSGYNKGDDINSWKINVNAVGDSSTGSLRPERVDINSTEGNFENSFNAKVKELIYLGDHIRTRVEVCGNDQFIVKVPNSYKGANLKEGASVKLSWKASDSRALDLA